MFNSWRQKRRAWKNVWEFNTINIHFPPSRSQAAQRDTLHVNIHSGNRTGYKLLNKAKKFNASALNAWILYVQYTSLHFFPPKVIRLMSICEVQEVMSMKNCPEIKLGKNKMEGEWRCVDYVSWPFLMKSTWNNICLKPQNICKRTVFFRAYFEQKCMSPASYWESFATVWSMRWFASHANRDYLSTALSMRF